MKHTLNLATIEKIFEFAKKMTQNHHSHFIGDNVTEKRDEREIFENVLQGKIAEEIVTKHVKSRYPNAVISSEVDYGIYSIGTWDNDDLIVNGKHLSIKASKHNAVALLIEASRFDGEEYNYLNNDGSKTIVDSYIFVTVDLAGFITGEDLKGDFDQFKRKHNINRISGDVKGFITHENFMNIKTLIPRGTPMSAYNLRALMLDGKNMFELKDSSVTMIADNFAVHSEQLKRF